MGGKDTRDPSTIQVRVYGACEALCVGVRVTPSAPRSELRGTLGERLKVAVAAPPEDNRANKELERSLAEWLEIGRGQVRVVKGHGSRDKVVGFSGLTEARLRQVIGAALQEGLTSGR